MAERSCTFGTSRRALLTGLALLNAKPTVAQCATASIPGWVSEYNRLWAVNDAYHDLHGRDAPALRDRAEACWSRIRATPCRSRADAHAKLSIILDRLRECDGDLGGWSETANQELMLDVFRWLGAH